MTKFKMERLMELESNAFDVSVLLGELSTTISTPVSESAAVALTALLTKQGIKMNTPEERVAAMAHVAKHAEKYRKLVLEYQEDQAKRALRNTLAQDPMVQEAATAIKGMKVLIMPVVMREVIYVDDRYNGVLLPKLVEAVGEDYEDIAAYIREVAGIKTHMGKAVAAYTSDTVRFTGLSAEAILDATGDFISWAFHTAGDGVRIGTEYVGKGIDKLTGGRAEEVKDVNLVEESIMPHVEKTQNWFRSIKEKAVSKLAEKKQA